MKEGMLELNLKNLNAHFTVYYYYYYIVNEEPFIINAHMSNNYIVRLFRRRREHYPLPLFYWSPK